MNDTKNLLLAWISSTSTIFVAFDGGAWIAVVSAVVLPIVFFAVGKTIDVALQIYLKRRDDERRRRLNDATPRSVMCSPARPR